MSEQNTLTVSENSCNREDEDTKDLPTEDESGVLFYVNKDGFPIKEKTWERMWQHVEKIHPKGPQIAQSIRDNQKLVKVKFIAFECHKSANCLFLDKWIRYNHTGTQFFEIKKWRPLTGLMETAREMIKESLPIKCLEAVVLGLYLTCGISDLHRFTISFKTNFNGRFYRHVVLGVHYYGKFGTLGLSRRNDLMFKSLKFKNLFDLLEDFTVSYNNYHHILKKIKLSLPVVHDTHSCERIQWKYLTLSPLKTCQLDVKKVLDKFTREIRITVSGHL
ncbi:Tubulinyl-Tyr carboxypeptidase 1 [Acropora cervicornis]|uniref:Tubulinyl-Tyr carboxypeptidase 1 n=1 Tax=Acropora cervicornis TaxID=6130 RepID=A0AAD9QWM4_ACRCE|nr:Tubulinyl-Tyr carboxypeptidase 1 [Acropora cervicornis]